MNAVTKRVARATAASALAAGLATGFAAPAQAGAAEDYNQIVQDIQANDPASGYKGYLLACGTLRANDIEACGEVKDAQIAPNIFGLLGVAQDAYGGVKRR